MAFDPYASYDMTNAFAVTPAQRLQSALPGTKYGKTGAQQQYTLGTFDTAKAYKKQIPQIEAAMARRGVHDSGMRNLALAEAAAQHIRQQDQHRRALQDALFNATLQNINAYGTYAGERYGSTLGAATSQAEMAAKIREAMG
jgi:predicted DNA-binding WGR domain protein